MDDAISELLNNTDIMVLSTVDKAGSWVSPVGYSLGDGKLELTFMSMLDTRHVENILANNRVSVAIYDYSKSDDVCLGLQIQGRVIHADTLSDTSWNSFTVVPDEAWFFDPRHERTRQAVRLSN